MSASPQRVQIGSVIGWQSLATALARINPLRPRSIPAAILEALCEHFQTDRASMVFFNGEEGNAGDLFSTAMPDEDRCNAAGDEVAEVRSTCMPMLVHDTTKKSARTSKNYRTSNYALLPLSYDRECFAVVCLSNLTSQVMLELDASGDQLSFLVIQLEQLGMIVAGSSGTDSTASELDADEVSLLGLIAEKLDTELESRSVFSRFVELVQPVFPLDALSLIYAHEDMAPRGIVCIGRAASRASLDRAFSEIARQWQRRKGHKVALSLSDARLYGEELVVDSALGSTATDLRHTEVIPLFVDNDLFAIVSVSLPDIVVHDRRKMRLLSFLLHQLMVHVKKNELLERNSSLQTLDALTGLFNERHFFQQMEREFDRASRYKVPLCLQVFDVDHFKDVNEAYGFEIGDQLLREISRILMENVRSTDLVCRYGGERFLLLLPETPGKNADLLANRLRRYIENFSFFIPNTNVFIKVTVSSGVASFLEHKPVSVAQFVEFADTALYFAKRNGRNQVVGYGYVMNLMLGETGQNG